MALIGWGVTDLLVGLREEDRVGTGIVRPRESTCMSLFERGTVFAVNKHTDIRVYQNLCV